MLKNVLSLLLSKFYSKQEAELVGHQAMPKLSQYIDLTSIATANVENTYVAPTDGYFVCATKGGELSGVNVWGTLDAGVPGASGIQGKVFTPCVKGASVHYIIYGTIHLVRFYKTIGGGGQTLKKLILQGGGLCLNSLSSSLRRCSCRINVRLSRRGITRRIPEPDYSLLQGRTTILSLPPTALSRLFCAKILKGSALVLSRKGEATAKNAQELMRQTYLDGTRHSSLFKKASESNFHPRFSAPLQDVSFCLTKPNLTVGGASC